MFTKIYHFSSFTLCGGELHLTTKENLMDPMLLNEYIRENEIDVLTVPPFLTEKLDVEQLKLRKLLTAGSESKKSIAEKMGQKLDYYNAYGPTEDSICSAIWQYKANDYNMAPIGKPVPNHRIYVLDERRHLVPIGFPGELCVSGIGLARGYLNRPDLTAEKFVENPYEPGEKMYCTGDLVRWMEDGNIEYLGRIDNQVKIRGFRIELGEINENLLKISGIKDAVVVAFDDENGKYLSAYYNADRSYDAVELTSKLKKNLPDYMLPANYIRLDKIPLTVNGKLDETKLPKETIKKEIKENMSAEERQIYNIVAKTLNINDFVVSDNLFDLGMDSVRVMQVVSELGKAGYLISVADVFRHPSISEIKEFKSAEEVSVIDELTDNVEDSSYLEDAKVLLKRIEQENANLSLEILSNRVTETYELLPIQYEYLNSPQISGSIVNIHCELGDEAVKEAVREVLASHDVFRSVLKKWKGNYKWQVYMEQEDCEIPFFDIQQYDITMRGPIVMEIIRGMNQSRFDTLGELLYHIAVLKTGSLNYYVILVADHIIYDGVSDEIIKSELRELCKNPEKRSICAVNSYRDYGELIMKNAANTDVLKLIDVLRLKEFCANKKKLNIGVSNNYVVNRYNYPLKEDKDILLQIYEQIFELSQEFFNGNELPVIMVNRGRDYADNSFFDTVGNCLDVVPLLIGINMESESIKEQRNFIKDHNINFSAVARAHVKKNAIFKRVFESPGIIVNIQGAKGRVPKVLDSDDLYKQAVKGSGRLMYVVRYDSEIELIQIRPAAYKSKGYGQMWLEKIRKKPEVPN